MYSERRRRRDSLSLHITFPLVGRLQWIVGFVVREYSWSDILEVQSGIICILDDIALFSHYLIHPKLMYEHLFPIPMNEMLYKKRLGRFHVRFRMSVSHISSQVYSETRIPNVIKNTRLGIMVNNKHCKMK